MKAVIFTQKEKTLENLNKVLWKIPNHNWKYDEKHSWLNNKDAIGVGVLTVGLAYSVLDTEMISLNKEVETQTFREFVGEN